MSIRVIRYWLTCVFYKNHLALRRNVTVGCRSPEKRWREVPGPIRVEFRVSMILLSLLFCGLEGIVILTHTHARSCVECWRWDFEEGVCHVTRWANPSLGRQKGLRGMHNLPTAFSVSTYASPCCHVVTVRITIGVAGHSFAPRQKWHNADDVNIITVTTCDYILIVCMYLTYSKNEKYWNMPIIG